MGASLSEDSVNAIDGSKVDDHLRALFALEGRSSDSSSPLAPTFGFTKVELPEFGVEVEKKPDLTALPSKPSFNANNSLAGKRDSFGKLLTPAFNAKKELQTLLEEDEGDDFTSDPGSPVVPVPAPRHRPRSLNLRSSLIRLSASLPTPSPTPSVRTPKLKSLTLASSTVVTSSPPRNDNYPKRSSTLVISHSSPLLSAAEVEHVHRQSSISYQRTSTSEVALGLPSGNTNSQTLTPSPSPTFEKHRRSLSPTELLAQSAYFAQSHASFLARIAELESALARSTATPSPAPAEPPEELLEMLADLKAERDLLKRSLEELVVRYNDQEKQINALGRRLDNEKRDGWVHKEKLSRAEAEKRTMEKENEDLNEELASMRLQLQTARAQAHAEKESRLKTERELHAALDAQKVAAAPYPYPTAYRRTQESIDSELIHEGDRHNFEAQPSQVERHLVQEEEDSDTSFHSRSVSSVSYGSGLLSRQPSSIATPDDSQRDLSSGWSFAKASRRVKPKASVDNFFSCLEDSDGAVPIESVGLPSLKSDSSPGGFSIGFGLSPDEDEDSTFNFGQPSSPSPFPGSDEDSSFNFGQPASPSPFPRSDESDEEIPSGPVEPTPFIDDEDAAFSFATPENFYSTPTPSLAQVIFTANNNNNNNGNTPHHSPPPTIPKFVDPTTPRPRHKAKDSMHLRRRSRNDRQSVDLLESFSSFLPETGPAPRSAPPSNSSFTFPRSSTAPARSQATPQLSLLDIAIPSGSIGSSLPAFDLDALSPPPRKSTRVQAPAPRNPSGDEGTSRRARVSPPVFVPSPPPRSAARSDDTHTRVSISRSAESRRRGQQSSQQQEPPTPPPSTPSKSPMTSLSFAALANLFPSSWTSPRSSVSASSPTSSMGRDSFDRSYVSREQQLNRLRSEVEQSRSQSQDRGQSRGGKVAL